MTSNNTEIPSPLAHLPSPMVSPQGNSSAIISVVRDPTQPIGKQFTLRADGTFDKKSSVNLAFGIAVMHHVRAPEDLVKLLTKVGNDPHAAIINSGFNGIPVGEEFLIVSAKKLEELTGIPQSDRDRQQGIREVEYDGKLMKAICRFNENMHPSNWLLIDRDVDKHTPAKYANLTTQKHLTKVSAIISGIASVTCIETQSSSSRVMLDGQPVGAGSGHIWIFVENPAAIEAARKALIILAAQAEMTWQKPRYSRTEVGKVVGQSLTTIIDPSVWGLGRLVFTGQPGICEGLTVVPLSPVIHQGENDALDLSTVVMPDAETVRQVTRAAGVEMTVSGGGNNIRITAEDLTLDTEIETKDHGTLPVRSIIAQAITGKLRCQSPFRGSISYAALYSVNAEGIPFVYDNGTSITHWLNPFLREEAALIKAKAVVKNLLETVKDDSAAVLEDASLDALATLKNHNPAEYNRKRGELKRVNPKVPLTDMDRAVKDYATEANPAQTHHGYAKSLLAQLTVGKWVPVSHNGALYVLDPASQLWRCLSVDRLVFEVAEMHDGKERCERSGDYVAIANHAISLASNDSSFATAAVGIAYQGGFYRIEGDKVINEALTADHYQRFSLEFKPRQQDTPLFNLFLSDTFTSPNAGEETAQRELVQEITGAIMLGLMPKFQKAILYYDPYGRAGKGTLERMQRKLVPKEFVSAISPFKWNHDYHVATLAGKRMNVVGELPENEPIPAAVFKSVLGGDQITGRHPTHRPIMFHNEAAHVFMSNHLIHTRDHSEAFFARWLIVEFPNSRLRSGLPLDSALPERIIESEMPGIAYWALEGAARLLRNGKFTQSTAHDRLMAKWRRSANTLEEFIGDACVTSKVGEYRRSELYRDYTAWCSENGRKPFAKGRVKELLEGNLSLGVRLVEVNGYEIFRGLGKRYAREDQAATTSTALSPVPDLSGLEDMPDTTATTPGSIW